MVDSQVPAPIPESSQRMLESLQSLCRKHEAQLLLISVPNAAVWDLERHRQVAALAEELGLHYLDMNLEQVGLDWQTDCLDGGDHLNEWGPKRSAGIWPPTWRTPACSRTGGKTRSMQGGTRT